MFVKKVFCDQKIWKHYLLYYLSILFSIHILTLNALKCSAVKNSFKLYTSISQIYLTRIYSEILLPKHSKSRIIKEILSDFLLLY